MELGYYKEARNQILRLTERMRGKVGSNQPGTIENISTLSVAERKVGRHSDVYDWARSSTIC